MYGPCGLCLCIHGPWAIQGRQAAHQFFLPSAASALGHGHGSLAFKKPGLCWWPMVSHSPLQSILVDALGPWAATNLAVACSLELPDPNPGLAIPGAAMD